MLIWMRTASQHYLPDLLNPTFKQRIQVLTNTCNGGKSCFSHFMTIPYIFVWHAALYWNESDFSNKRILNSSKTLIHTYFSYLETNVVEICFL